jgi:hypothetical protein
MRTTVIPGHTGPTLLAGVLAVSTLALAACNGTAKVAIASQSANAAVATGASSASSGTAVQPAPSGAAISIVQPAEGARVPAGDVSVAYQVPGLTLVSAADAKKLTDYHVHVLLDTDPLPYIGGFTPVPTGNDRIIHTAAPSVAFKNVAPGQHSLAVFVTTSNHVSVKPPILARSTFTAE